MHLLYQSDSYIVVRFEVPTPQEAPAGSLSRGGFEIVDKFARKEIFIEGALAQQFQEGVDALSAGESSEEDYDDFIETYANLGNTPVLMH
ncbi:BTH_I0359 family protein [Pseudorhodoferax sp.]|jgi:hypothetical protein|uniref:BTH_I0359 family protein n=1 Tax=Pseudorhodoferax sp. TaxID=1993553 RepID=UPI001B6E154A|nr:DUF3567 domain-containing protein [Pseudorhodoferax sp.]MBP8143704.1 DUF3567 domain-containing protein [Inhella sp.]